MTKREVKNLSIIRHYDHQAGGQLNLFFNSMPTILPNSSLSCFYLSKKAAMNPKASSCESGPVPQQQNGLPNLSWILQLQQ
jgi:hypothetical protein